MVRWLVVPATSLPAVAVILVHFILFRFIQVRTGPSVPPMIFVARWECRDRTALAPSIAMPVSGRSDGSRIENRLLQSMRCFLVCFSGMEARDRSSRIQKLVPTVSRPTAHLLVVLLNPSRSGRSSPMSRWVVRFGPGMMFGHV